MFFNPLKNLYNIFGFFLRNFKVVNLVMKPIVQFQRLTTSAIKPTKATQGAAGFDLHSAHNYIIPPKEKKLVFTDIAVAIPEGFYGRIAPRSGLAVKHFIDVGAGVIDCDYRGNIGVLLFNFGNDSFHIKEGDRIAQLICEMAPDVELEEVGTLDVTTRGVSGFGSTGNN
jgi:dUTP pyrophosphatase